MKWKASTCSLYKPRTARFLLVFCLPIFLQLSGRLLSCGASTSAGALPERTIEKAVDSLCLCRAGSTTHVRIQLKSPGVREGRFVCAGTCFARRVSGSVHTVNRDVEKFSLRLFPEKETARERTRERESRTVSRNCEKYREEHHSYVNQHSRAEI